MGLLQKFFPKKDDESLQGNSLQHRWPELPVPAVMETGGNKAVLGKYSLEKQLGELQQARPPKKAQILLGKDQKNQPVYVGLIPPGEENQQWLEQRLGSIRNAKWTTVKAQGYFRKLGDQLSLLTFETVLADRYLIKKCLCADPLQETYEAFDTKEEKQIYCTVSIPNSSNALPEKFIKRQALISKEKSQNPENRILRVLDEGICKPFGLFAAYRFKHPALYYVITQYIPAVNFIHFLKQEKQKILPEIAVSLVQQVVSIIAQMKKEGLQHGNLRPHTLWVGSEGEYKGKLYLNGFSMLHSNEDYNKSAWQILRNCARHAYPLYMSPEQVSSKTVDLRADIFTMAIVLYELITGRNPFRSSEKDEEMKKVASWDVSKLSAIPASFKWLSPFLVKWLQAKPENREFDWISFEQSLGSSYLEWASEDAEEILETPKKKVVQPKPLEEKKHPEIKPKKETKAKEQQPDPSFVSQEQEETEFEEMEMLSSKEEKKHPEEKKAEPKVYLFERFLSSFNRGIKKEKPKEKAEEQPKETQPEQPKTQAIEKSPETEQEKNTTPQKIKVPEKTIEKPKEIQKIPEKNLPDKPEESQELEELSQEEMLLLERQEDSPKEVPRAEDIEELSEEELQNLAVQETKKEKQAQAAQEESQEEWEDLEENKQETNDTPMNQPEEDVVENLDGDDEKISSLKEKTVPVETAIPKKEKSLEEEQEEKGDFFFQDLQKIKKSIEKKEEPDTHSAEQEKQEVSPSEDSIPLGFKEEEEFEWEKEFQVVTNSFVEWEDDSDEEDIFGSDTESKKETPKSKK
ncbi:MAG: protein kinase [Candidatus Brocadiae bacterium]|nr:protein kinase [Candidatus Brocadiia bacterium]